METVNAYVAAFSRAATEADKYIINRYGRILFEDDKIMTEWLNKFEELYAKFEISAIE